MLVAQTETGQKENEQSAKQTTSEQSEIQNAVRIEEDVIDVQAQVRKPMLSEAILRQESKPEAGTKPSFRKKIKDINKMMY